MQQRPSTPYPFHFYVTADDNRVEVDQVSVGGSMVTLTLATAAMRETLLADLADGHLEPEALADLEARRRTFQEFK